jgi:hypothetical protein
MEASTLTAMMPTMMLIVTLSEGYCQLPGTKPYVFLRRTQPTTNLAGNVDIFCLQNLILKTSLLCCPNLSAQYGQHVAAIATLKYFFHVICRVVSLIADMLSGDYHK